MKIMKFAHVCIFSLLIISCKDSKPRTADNNEESKKSKIARNHGLSRVTRTAEIWKQWGRSESRRADLDRLSLERMLNEISAKRYSQDGRGEFEILIGELASRDPVAAMSYFSPENMRASEPGFLFVASLLSQTDPDLLKSWLNNELKSGPLNVRANCLSSALECLASVEPESALDFYLKGSWDTVGRSDAISSLFLSWARKSPLEALAAAEKSLTGKDLDSALYNILIVEKVKNPEAAMGIASKIGDPTSRADAIGSIVSSWMELDPDSAVNRLKSFSGPDLQKILMLDLSTDIEKSVLNKMARRDPIQLISLIQKLVPSNSNEDLFKSAVFTLSNHSPDQVAGLLETLPEGDLKKSLRVTELSVLFRENPDAIVGRINDLKDEASRIEAYKAVGGMTNAENYNLALSALGELTATQKNAFIAEAIPRVAETDSVKAAEILAQSEIPVGDNRRNQLITTVASGLARDNPSYADGWMYNLPEDQQVFAMKGIAEAIARKDIRALSEKLAVFPKGKNWTAGVTVLIENLKSSDPAMAKSWQDALDVEKTK